MRFVRKAIKFMVIFDLLALGVGLALKVLLQSEGDESSDEFKLATILFGSEFVSSAESFRHGVVTTYMGGVEVDLTGATIEHRATLSLLTVMGGVSVRVPDTWRVNLNSSVTAGDAQLTAEGQDDLPADAPVLNIDARTIMAGVDIRAVSV